MYRVRTAIVIVAMMGLVGGCSESVLPADSPEGHTVNEDGIAHMTGHGDPEANCVSCHGDDLRGGTNGEPSCFSCHGQEW